MPTEMKRPDLSRGALAHLSDPDTISRPGKVESGLGTIYPHERHMRKKMKKIGLSLLAVTFITQISAQNWPQWRGPDGRGISQETDLPLTWSPEKNVLWKASVPGTGHSSPVIWGDQIFLTSAIQGKELPEPTAAIHYVQGQVFKHPDWAGSNFEWAFKVFALEKSSGKISWERTAYAGPVYDHIHRRNTYASGTPVTDGEFLYAYFGAEGLYCYDLEGKLIWKKSFDGIGTVGMGNGTSPVLFEDQILLVIDQEMGGTDSFLLSLDRKTGEEQWRVARKARVTWSTPILVEQNGQPILVVAAAEANIAYDPRTGREIWKTEGLVSHAIPSPVTDHEVVFLSAGSGPKHTMAVRLGGSGDLTGSDHIVWKYQKGSAYVPSSIYYQGHLYLVSDKGIITCLDGKTGEVIYEGGRMPVAAEVKASPVAFADKILITNEDGATFVIKAGPEFEVLSSNSVGEPVWASPAISDGTIFIRGREHLFAIGR